MLVDHVSSASIHNPCLCLRHVCKLRYVCLHTFKLRSQHCVLRTPAESCAKLSLQAEFVTQITRIHEMQRLREEEVEGQWMTEEKMRTEMGYSVALVSKIKQYCLRFKAVLVRPFKYDASQSEFFVQTSDTVKIKKSELERWIEQTDTTDEAGPLTQLTCSIGFLPRSAFAATHLLRTFCIICL